MVWRLWLIAVGYWLVMSALVCTIYPATISDTMARYAPMADAFARGDFRYAFHPRFGVLFQVVSGILTWLTGLPGDKACQSTALLFLALSVVPIWFLVRRLFGERVAFWVVIALLVSDEFTRLCYNGLRDTGKCLAFALLGLGVVEERPLPFAAGLFVLIALVSYGFALATLLVGLWCVYMFAARRPSSVVLPLVGWLAGTAGVTVMVHAYSGHWVPVVFFIRFVGAWL